MARNDYIDPQGHWVDANRSVRRISDKDGEQVVIPRATPLWFRCRVEARYEAIVACVNLTKK